MIVFTGLSGSSPLDTIFIEGKDDTLNRCPHMRVSLGQMDKP